MNTYGGLLGRLLGGELLAGRLATGGLASGLLLDDEPSESVRVSGR